MRYYAIYVERFCGSIDDPEWHSPECLLGGEMTLDELKCSYPISRSLTSSNDFIYVIDETDYCYQRIVPYKEYTE